MERPTISADGWPPRIIVTWKAMSTQSENGTLTYDVICCTCTLRRCHQALNRLSNGSNSSDLQLIPWCQRLSSKPGVTFQCNVTGVKNCERTSSQLETKHFSAVIKVSNYLGVIYSNYRVLSLFEYCKYESCKRYNF